MISRIYLQMDSAALLFIPQAPIVFDEFWRRKLFGIFNQGL